MNKSPKQESSIFNITRRFIVFFFKEYLNKDLVFITVKCVFIITMGSVASVMQFKCLSCQKINATERRTCYSCGTPRSVILVDNHKVTASSEIPAVVSDANNAIASSYPAMELPSSNNTASVGSGLARSVSHTGEDFASKGKSKLRNHSHLKHSVSYVSKSGEFIFHKLNLNIY